MGEQDQQGRKGNSRRSRSNICDIRSKSNTVEDVVDDHVTSAMYEFSTALIKEYVAGVVIDPVTHSGLGVVGSFLLSGPSRTPTPLTERKCGRAESGQGGRYRSRGQRELRRRVFAPSGQWPYPGSAEAPSGQLDRR